MTKFKKTISRVLCGLSAFVFMFSALFYPLENFKADTSRVVYENGNFVTSRVSLPIASSDSVSDFLYGSFNYRATSPSYVFTDSPALSGYVKVELNMYGAPVIQPSDLNFTFSHTVSAVYMGEEYKFLPSNASNLPYVCSFYARTGDWGNRIFYVVDCNCTYFESIPTPSNFSIKFDYWSCFVRISSVDIDEEILLNEISDSLASLESDNDTIISYLNSIKSSTASTVTKLNSLITYTQELIDSVDELTTEMQELQSLVNITNSYLAEIEAELETQTTWLERIWNTIVDIFDASDEQEDKVDSFNSESKEQSDNINGMVGSMNSVDKPQANPDSIDQFIPSSDSFVIVALDSVMGFGPVTNSILCVMLMALVAYVLFGKR